jgi:SulP family sulfate permease
VPRNDALVIVLVTVITVFTDLAIAVLCGIVIAALNFAWQHAREIRADFDEHDGEKNYRPHGTLFFASTVNFQALFDPFRDPDRVRLDCSHLHVADHSGVAAIEALLERYERAGKQVRLENLSVRNRLLLERAGAMSD